MTRTDRSDTAVLLAFARLVSDLRKAQRNARAALSQGANAEDAVAAAERLEKAVDAEVADILDLTTPCLFDLTPEGGK